MKLLIRLCLLLLVCPLMVNGQYTLSDLDKIYGLDPLLFNGKLYSYFPPSTTGGSPFFNGPEFVEGSARIRGMSYDHLLLNYDVFNQQIVMQYKNDQGNLQLIVLSDAWLESIELEETHFEILRLEDSFPQIYQLIGSSPIQILYAWRKELETDNRMGSTYLKFSKLKKESFLFSGSGLFKYKNNRSFASYFNPKIQTDIKKYLRQHQLNMKKNAGQDALVELLNYCNSLSMP